MKEHDFVVRLLVTEQEMKSPLLRRAIITVLRGMANRKLGPNIPIEVWLTERVENSYLYLGVVDRPDVTQWAEQTFEPFAYYIEKDAYLIERGMTKEI